MQSDVKRQMKLLVTLLISNTHSNFQGPFQVMVKAKHCIMLRLCPAAASIQMCGVSLPNYGMSQVNYI